MGPGPDAGAAGGGMSTGDGESCTGAPIPILPLRILVERIRGVEEADFDVLLFEGAGGSATPDAEVLEEE